MTTAPQPDPHTNLRSSLRAAAERAFADARLSEGPPRSSRTAVHEGGGVGRGGAGRGLTGESGHAVGVDGVGVTLVVGGESVFGGANPFTDAVDEIQYDVGEGPCLSAVASGRIVTSTRIATTERRWSRFTPAAAALDLRSVRSTPITTADQVIGSVNMYSRTSHGLDAITPRVLRRLAAAAELALDSARLLALAESGARHLAQALDARAVIEHAVGLLVDRYRMNANEARTLLGQLARHDDTTDAEAARALTDSAPGR